MTMIFKIFEIRFKDNIIVKFFEKFFIIFVFIKVSAREYNICSINNVLFVIVMKYIFDYNDIKI